MNKKQVLVISPIPSHPQNAGNRIRIFNLLNEIRKLNYEIVFLYIDFEQGSKHVKERPNLKQMKNTWNHFYYYSDYAKRGRNLKISLLQTRYLSNFNRKLGIIANKLHQASPFLYFKIRKILLGSRQSFFNNKLIDDNNHQSSLKSNNYKSNFSYKVDDWYPEQLVKSIEKIKQNHKIYAVMCEYVYISKSLLSFDNSILKIIDTHDRFANRNTRLEGNNLKDDAFTTSVEEETKGLNRADIVFAIQDKEKLEFESTCHVPVITIGHYLNIKNLFTIESNRRNIVYVGTSNKGNIQAMNYFLQKIWPKVLKQNQKTQLVLAGAICKEYAHIENCIKLNELNDVTDVYRLADVAINTAQTGTGLKIKSLEPLAYGIPLVCTPHSAIGIPFDSGILVEDNPDKFIEALNNILCNDLLRQDLSKKGIQFAKNYNQNITNKLKLVLDQNNQNISL